MLKRIATLLLGVGLIGLGTLFFLSSQDSEISQLVIDFWPVFLIFAGMIRLAGFFIDRHPRSPMSGVMLIAIGGIYLSANLLGHHSLSQVLQKYWFWLLLAYLGGRLMKQYSYHRADGPLRSRAFTMGSVFMMALIVGSGLAADHTDELNQSIKAQLEKTGILSHLFFGNEYAVEESSLHSFSLPEDADLILDAIPGNIEITTSAQSIATVRITKRVSAVDRQEAREQAQKISIEITDSGENLTMRVTRPEIAARFETHLVITLPQDAKTKIDIRNAGGEIKLHGLRGEKISISGQQDIFMKSPGPTIAGYEKECVKWVSY